VKKPPRWISKQAVLAIHERLLAEHGGAPGLLDDGLLDAALASPRNRFAYERADVPRLAATYAYAITQNHPFADGNKRVALTVAGVFMELNGVRLEAAEREAAQATRALSSREIGEAEFAAWLRSCSTKRRGAHRRRRGPPTPRRLKGPKKK
jgi:death-on-curing protein